MALKLPRTLRLDPSDTFVYAHAAEPGEVAVTGTFLFYGMDLQGLAGKPLQAFRGGFLGIGSFGWSTLVEVCPVSEADRDAAVAQLAAQLVRHCGAPGLEAASAAATEEISFAASLCEHPEGTLLGLHRRAEGDAVRETFRTLHRRADRIDPLAAFRVVEVVEEEPGAAEGVEDEVDLLAMAKAWRP